MNRQNLPEIHPVVQYSALSPQEVVTCYNCLYNEWVVLFVTRSSISVLTRPPRFMVLVAGSRSTHDWSRFQCSI